MGVEMASESSYFVIMPDKNEINHVKLGYCYFYSDQ